MLNKVDFELWNTILDSVHDVLDRHLNLRKMVFEVIDDGEIMDFPF